MIVVNSNAGTSDAHEQSVRRTATFADMAATMRGF
ncbi:hypothetical protein SVXHx_2193 [Haloferax volcanii]|nr:hypothetical protein SVXHx_2193 [Haloferax lucentense]